MIAPWPAADAARFDDDAERDMEPLQAIVVEIRRFRARPQHRAAQAIEACREAGTAATRSSHPSASELKALALAVGRTVGEQPDGWSRVVAGAAEIYPAARRARRRGGRDGAPRTRDRRGREARSRRADEARQPEVRVGAPADVVEKVRRQLAEQPTAQRPCCVHSSRSSAPERPALNFEQAIEFLNSRIRFGMRPGTERVAALVEALGQPAAVLSGDPGLRDEREVLRARDHRLRSSARWG